MFIKGALPDSAGTTTNTRGDDGLLCAARIHDLSWGIGQVPGK